MQTNGVNPNSSNWVQEKAQGIRAQATDAHPQAEAQKKPAEANFTTDLNKIPGKMHPNCAGCVPLFDGPDPKSAIDEVRYSQGSQRVMSLMQFQEKIDVMTKPQLIEAQDYLVKLVSDPHNQDDTLLGALLSAVNKELNGRDQWQPMPPGPRPMPPININDIDPRPVD